MTEPKSDLAYLRNEKAKAEQKLRACQHREKILEPNIGVATVAAEAGHAQPSTTLAIYTQVYDRRRDEIRKQMSRELYK